MRTLTVLAAALLLAWCGPRWGAAHNDVVDGPRGMENSTDRLVGQGRSTSQDRAYAAWAQYDDNLTELLEHPLGQRWITVGEAIPWAKRVWDVNILDETSDPRVAKVRFAMSFGPVERDMALPLFLAALASAISSAQQDCYVEQDETASYGGGFRNYHKGTVHIRRARVLQPDYDHPSNLDKIAIRQLEAALTELPTLTDRCCGPAGHLAQRCMDCQAEAAAAIARYIAICGTMGANSAPCLCELADICKRCRHCQAAWITSQEGPHDPEVQSGTGNSLGPATK
jgi:hypothetical protein